MSHPAAQPRPFDNNYKARLQETGAAEAIGYGPRSDSLGVLKSKGLRSAAAAAPAGCDQISTALRAALIPALFWRDETGRDS